MVVLNEKLIEATARNPHAAMMEKLEELAAYSHIALLQFPKIEKFLLCAEIRKSISDIIRGVITAWKKFHKKTTLSEIDIEIAMFRVLVRRAWSLKYINNHRFEIWARHIDEIGRMLGGMLKKFGKTENPVTKIDNINDTSKIPVSKDQRAYPA